MPLNQKDFKIMWQKALLVAEAGEGVGLNDHSESCASGNTYKKIFSLLSQNLDEIIAPVFNGDGH